MEYRNSFKSKNGVNVEICVKAECSSSEEMKEALSFMANSTHKFYMELAEKISSTL